MTAPFRDPIIYPGVPLEPAIGRWHRVPVRRWCEIGGEWMPRDTIARWTGSAYECRDHATAGDGDTVPRMSRRGWFKIYHPATCTLGAERIPTGAWARLAEDGAGWECRDHAQFGYTDSGEAA